MCIRDSGEGIPEIDSIPNMNFARYGKKLYAGGGYMGPRSYATGGRPGLWANVHAKRARGEEPAKPGDKDYPTAKAIKTSQNAMGGRLYNPGGYMSPMFAGPEYNDLNLETTGIGDDETYGGDMDNAFIDMSMSANPTDLINPMYNFCLLYTSDAADE